MNNPAHYLHFGGIHRLIWREYYHDVREVEQHSEGRKPDTIAPIPISDDPIGV